LMVCSGTEVRRFDWSYLAELRGLSTAG
jgi:hypothetical protein